MPLGAKRLIRWSGSDAQRRKHFVLQYARPCVQSFLPRGASGASRRGEIAGVMYSTRYTWTCTCPGAGAGAGAGASAGTTGVVVVSGSINV